MMVDVMDRSCVMHCLIKDYGGVIVVAVPPDQALVSL